LKILYLTDTHIRGNNPRSRTDDYSESIFRKLVEIGGIIERKGVTAIIHGGDVFHTPGVSYSVYSRTAEIFNSWFAKGADLFLCVVGSHDKFGYNDETLPRTALGALRAAGLVQILEDNTHHHHLMEDDVYICSTSHSYTLDTDPQNYEKIKMASKDYLIQFAHGMLMEKPFFGNHTLTKDVHTDSDLVITGHYHTGYNPHEHNGTTFLNIGSIGRVENSARVYPPSVLIFDTKTRTYEIIPLTTVENDVFLDKEIESQSMHEDIEQFMVTLKDHIGKIESYDVKQLIIQVGEQEKTAPEIIQKALEIIDE